MVEVARVGTPSVVPRTVRGAILRTMVRLATLGHSTRSLGELIELIQAHGIEQVADVRRFPASRRHPHFARAVLERELPAVEVAYCWLEDLGGMRRGAPGSPHTAWPEAAFAAYADHMDTPRFQRAARRLLELAGQRHTAIMCAEARPERCHRRLIADWLLVQGGQVTHLLSPTETRPHVLPDFARVEGERLIYDGPPRLPGF
jgi:uncharacterized protein (DUF488 family)